MKNFFIKEEFSFFVLLYTFIKKDTILTLIYIVMKISHIEHLGIAVKSIEEALPYYENVLGLKCYNIETVEDQKVRTAFLKVGDVKIELLEPTSPESTIAKFIEKNNGNGGALYDLYNNSALTIYAQGNHWSVDEQTAEKIESVIFHKPDDAKLGEVIYTPAWDGEGSVNEIASEAIRYADGKVYAEGADIQVYTLGGALVARANSVADLSALASGVYVARANGKVLKCVK